MHDSPPLLSGPKCGLRCFLILLVSSTVLMLMPKMSPANVEKERKNRGLIVELSKRLHTDADSIVFRREYDLTAQIHTLVCVLYF